jgi:carbon-monoxide dehydrogenase medium subunit
MDEQGICTKAGIGLTNVNPTPLRAVRSEAALVGTSLDDAAIALAAQYASEDCNPSTDLRGDIDYKRHIIRAVTKRMINKSKERAFKN